MARERLYILENHFGTTNPNAPKTENEVLSMVRSFFDQPVPNKGQVELQLFNVYKVRTSHFSCRGTSEISISVVLSEAKID